MTDYVPTVSEATELWRRTRHVAPVADAIVHATDTVTASCKCQPRREPVFRKGSLTAVGFVIVHNAMDGRQNRAASR